MNLYRWKTYRSQLVVFAAAMTLAPGCILSDDFGEGAGELTTSDAGPDADSTAGSDAGTDAADDTTPSDATPSDATPSDASAGDDYLPIDPTLQRCEEPATIYQVDQSNFGAAAGAFFSELHQTVYDIGQPSADAFPEIWHGHGVAVASATVDNQLAVGWASVDTDDLEAAAETNSTVQPAPMKYAGGTIIPLADTASADPLVVHDVELMMPRQGAALGRYQFYNILVFTNAGTYGCRVSAELENGEMIGPQAECQHASALDAVLSFNELYPVSSFEWLPVKGTARREIVGVATGGTGFQKSALVHYDPDDGFFGRFSVLEADNSIQWTSDSGPLFTAAQLAWGWPEYANDYPLVYMLDHAEQARAVELSYRDGGEASAGYFESSQAAELPLAPTTELTEGKFAFTYRLFGSAIDDTESHTSGFVGLDDAKRGVILGLDEPIGDTHWQIYETSDVTKLWSFPNGGPTLLALARGVNQDHLELATWDLATEFRTVGRAVSSDNHDVSGIDDVKVHSTWYYSATSFGDTAYRGVLGFAAYDSSSRALYLLRLNNVRDARSLCPPVN